MMLENKLVNQKDLGKSLTNKLLQDFHGNKIIINEEINTIPIVSNDCIEYFKSLLPDQESFIRISIEGGGCAGFQYAFHINEPPFIESDIVIFKNPKIIIDEESILYMKGAEIKIEKSPFSQRIYVDNPGAKSSCGCGTSFNYEL
jgi:iron-sulfur cluster assembly accessory protein